MGKMLKGILLKKYDINYLLAALSLLERVANGLEKAIQPSPRIEDFLLV
jgi:hypothetical protein